MVVHLSIDGNIILNETSEAGEQEDFIDAKKSEADAAIKASSVDEGMPSEMTYETLLRSLRNAFNYAERTSQTFSSVVKKRGVATEPPP
jgi:restriction endonuclease